MKKLINLSETLPPIKKHKTSRQEIRKISELAEKVKKILEKEARLQKENDENFSPRSALNY